MQPRITASLKALIVVLLVVLLTRIGPVDPAALLPSPAADTPLGVGAGALIALTAYVGFESAATLGVEARTPLRTIPRAVRATVVISLLLYLLAAAAQVAGFAALRRECGMNIRQVYPPRRPSDEVIADLTRIMELWAQARARFGGDGDFLFGAFGAADIMFAPVCTRIVTYSLPVARFATGYVEAVLNHPFMQDWIAAAQEEEWVIEKFEQPAGEA